MPCHVQLTPPSCSLEFQPKVLPSTGQGGPQRPALLPPPLSIDTQPEVMGLDPSRSQRALWFFKGLWRLCLSPKWEASRGQGACAGHEVEQAELVDGELSSPRAGPHPQETHRPGRGGPRKNSFITDTWMPHQKILQTWSSKADFQGGQRPRVSDSLALPPSHETSHPTVAWVPVSAPSPEEGAQCCREIHPPLNQPGQASRQPGGAVKPFPP